MDTRKVGRRRETFWQGPEYLSFCRKFTRIVASQKVVEAT